MITGWLSIAIGMIAIFIGLLNFKLGALSGWLLSDFKIGTRDEMKSRGVKPVFIQVRYFYARVLFRIFNISLGSQGERESKLITSYLLWALLLPFARITREIPNKGFSLNIDAGNLSVFMSILAQLGSYFSIFFGFLAIIFGVLSLVAPWVIDDWIPTIVTRLMNNYPWMGWLALGILVGAIVLLICFIIRRKHRKPISSKPSVATPRATADAQQSESAEKLSSGKSKSLIHTIANTLSTVGPFLIRIGRHNMAIKCLKKALEIHQEVGELNGQASNLITLGVAFHCKGELKVSLDKYRQAKDIFKRMKDRKGQASCLANIGTVYLDKRERDKAFDHYQKALLIFEEIDRHKEADMVKNMISRIDEL